MEEGMCVGVGWWEVVVSDQVEASQQKKPRM